MSTSKINIFLEKYSDLALAGIVIAIVGMMIVPLPTFLLDLLLSFNITIAITLLLISLYVPSVVKISAFPSILLITTLFRLALNVSSTRLILLHADAGEVIAAFGSFVVQGNYVVGAVIFLILTLIQFLVIAKGSERVSEVAARFTLDAMPGKQMSIDADLRAGALTQDEARKQRRELQRESQLYGAMDGAMKFVKGDSIASIIITTINIIAGMIVGIMQLEMAPGEAAEVYTVLTIGDGLVSQIPALLIATTSGLIVTRVASEDGDSHLGSDIFSQIFAHPKALGISAFLLIILALIPGLPTIPFLVLGGGVALVAFSLYTATKPENDEDAKAVKEIQTQAKSAAANAREMFPATTPLSVSIGTNLSRVLGEEGVQKLSDKLPSIREGIFHEFGVKVPGCRVKKNVAKIAPNQFSIAIDEIVVASGGIPEGYVLSSATQAEVKSLGVDSKLGSHPMSGRDVAWIPEKEKESIEAAGYRVWDGAQYIMIQLAATLKHHVADFTGIQETRALIEQLEGPFPATVEEVVPKLLSISELSEILKRLVEESISIRQLKQILEIIALRGQNEKDPIALTEIVREGLSRYITHKYTQRGNSLAAYTVDQGIEEMIASSVRTTETGTYLALPPAVTQEIINAFEFHLLKDVNAGRSPIILTDQRVRRYVKKLVGLRFPTIAVLSFQELDPIVAVQPLGSIAVGKAI